MSNGYSDDNVIETVSKKHAYEIANLQYTQCTPMQRPNLERGMRAQGPNVTFVAAHVCSNLIAVQSICIALIVLCVRDQVRCAPLNKSNDLGYDTRAARLLLEQDASADIKILL